MLRPVLHSSTLLHDKVQAKLAGIDAVEQKEREPTIVALGAIIQSCITGMSLLLEPTVGQHSKAKGGSVLKGVTVAASVQEVVTQARGVTPQMVYFQTSSIPYGLINAKQGTHSDAIAH